MAIIYQFLSKGTMTDNEHSNVAQAHEAQPGEEEGFEPLEMRDFPGGGVVIYDAGPNGEPCLYGSEHYPNGTVLGSKD